jgi:glycosyltransferase involved in cell wall biosynthesis
MALLPAEATLEVQGTGDAGEESRLQAVASSLGVADRISFERVPRSALPERYRAADVCVFPSEWEEPFGLVPLEAMACGTPVVATGTGGSGEFLVDGGNCVRFTAGSADSLADAVRRLAADEALRSRLIAAGFPTAEYFDLRHLTDAFEAWYSWAAAGSSGPMPPTRRFEL